MTPSATQTGAAPQGREIRIDRQIFDLDSKGDVSLRKVGQFLPVANMQEFVERMGNDSAKILEIVNDGLEEFTRKSLVSDPNVPWYELTEEGELKLDGEGDSAKPVPFAGTPLPEEKAKSFAASILNLAKALFGYPDAKLPKGASKEDQEKNRALKAEAKAKATDMVLSNPAAVEALKK